VRAFLLGTERDVRGFSLAGVGGLACRTAAELRRAIRELPGDVGLLLLSSETAEGSPAAVRRLQGSESTPVLLVLPPPGHGPAEDLS
jgi:vacuolar-type H+-ATPase subunit F/Vma7